MTEFRARRIDIGGIRLDYVERGETIESSKAPLLLLHGLIASAETLALSLAGLPDDRRIVALDLLTAGTIIPGDPMDLRFASLADLIARFAAEVGLERPILLGHSHGGALALQIAVSRCAVPGGLILLSPAHPFGGYSERLVRFYQTPLGRSFARVLPLLPRRWIDISRMAGPDATISRAQVERYRAALCLRSTVPRILRLLKSWQADMISLGRALRATPLRIPTLLLWGDCDSAVPLASAAALERFLLRSERITMPGVGHLPADESPALCVLAIRQWLGRYDSEMHALKSAHVE